MAEDTNHDSNAYSFLDMACVICGDRIPKKNKMPS